MVKQKPLVDVYLTLNIHNRKGKWLSSRSVKAIRCNRDWVWVEDHLGETDPIGQYNNDTGNRLGPPVMGKYLCRLVPEEIKPLKPFSKLDYIRRNKPIRPAPVKVVKPKKPKAVKYHWRVILASGKNRMVAGKTKEEVIEKATRISRGKPPQKILSRVHKAGFRLDFNGPAEVGKIDETTIKTK